MCMSKQMLGMTPVLIILFVWVPTHKTNKNLQQLTTAVSKTVFTFLFLFSVVVVLQYYYVRGKLMLPIKVYLSVHCRCLKKKAKHNYWD